MNTLTLPEPAVAGRPANGINHAHIPPRIAKIPAPTPNHILQTGLGFWASKTLLSATELGVFTELAKGSLDADTLRLRLGIHTG